MVLYYNVHNSGNYCLYIYFINRNAIKKLCRDNNTTYLSLFNIVRFKQSQHLLYNKLPRHHKLKLKQFYN